LSNHWTEDEFAIALEMLARGDDNAAFLAAFGKTKKAAQTRRDRMKYGSPPRIYGKNRSRPCRTIAVSAQALADATHRASLEHVSLTAALCGDPLPGRSALDRRRSA
jgi:hypothetical protein